MCPQTAVPQKIENYIQKRQTISNTEIAQTFNISEITAMNYLSRLAKTGTIKNIGKGTYQVTTNKQTTHIKPTQELTKVTNELCSIFPTAKFTAWSLQMLSNYSHYMIGKDLIIIETNKTLSTSIRDYLLTKGHPTILTPTKRDYKEYTLHPKTPIFILERKETYNLTQQDDYLTPTPERLWIDLYYLSTRKELTFDLFELGLIFAAMTEQGDINFDRLLRYATRRGIYREILLFLYELTKQNVTLSPHTMEAIFGRQNAFKTIENMVKGAQNHN